MLVLAAAALFWTVISSADTRAQSTDAPRRFVARVTAIVDPVTIRFTDGREARLLHLHPPRPSYARRQTVDRLAGLTLGQELRFDLGDPGISRHGLLRIEAAARIDAPSIGAEIGLQLVREGRLLVFPEPGAPPARIAVLLDAERAAREGDAGNWKTGLFSIAAAQPFTGHTDDFGIVEGVVRKASRVGSRRHLEFGPDWRTDFTVGLSGDARKKWGDHSADTATTDKTIRVRGWIRWWNGPYMEIDDGFALELNDAISRMVPPLKQD